jgi:hypothetical protein
MLETLLGYRTEPVDPSANPAPCRHRAEISPDFKRLLDFSSQKVQNLAFAKVGRRPSTPVMVTVSIR